MSAFITDYALHDLLGVVRQEAMKRGHSPQSLLAGCRALAKALDAKPCPSFANCVNEAVDAMDDHAAQEYAKQAAPGADYARQLSQGFQHKYGAV